MRTTLSRRPTRRLTALRGSLAVGLAAVLVSVGAGTANAAGTAIPLGDAYTFAVLAGQGVTATGTNVLNGDLGTWPNPSITGPGTITVNGTNHGDGPVSAQAQIDLTSAYVNAAGQGPTQPIAAGLDGLTLTPDVYNHASQLLLSGGELILDAQGDPNAVWVFQSDGDIVVEANSQVTLINGAQACNVYWQATSSASFNTDVNFVGTVMALTSITAATGGDFTGRLLARNGSVTLDSNTVTVAPCATAPAGTIQTGDGSTAATTGAGASNADMAWVVGGLAIMATGVVAVAALRSRRTYLA